MNHRKRIYVLMIAWQDTHNSISILKFVYITTMGYITFRQLKKNSLDILFAFFFFILQSQKSQLNKYERFFTSDYLYFKVHS